MLLFLWKPKKIDSMKMKEITKDTKSKKWNVTLKVSLEEEKKIKIHAINMGLGVADYIKQAALENLSIQERTSQGKFS